MTNEQKKQRCTRIFCWVTILVGNCWAVIGLMHSIVTGDAIYHSPLTVVALLLLVFLTAMIALIALIFWARKLLPLELSLNLLYLVAWQITCYGTDSTYRIVPVMFAVASTYGVVAWFLWKTSEAAA